MADFVQLFSKFLTKEQVKYLIYKLTDVGFLEKQGKGSGTKYIIAEEIEKKQQLVSRAIELGFEQMIKLGEMGTDKNA